MISENETETLVGLAIPSASTTAGPLVSDMTESCAVRLIRYGESGRCRRNHQKGHSEIDVAARCAVLMHLNGDRVGALNQQVRRDIRNDEHAFASRIRSRSQSSESNGSPGHVVAECF